MIGKNRDAMNSVPCVACSLAKCTTRRRGGFLPVETYFQEIRVLIWHHIPQNDVIRGSRAESELGRTLLRNIMHARIIESRRGGERERELEEKCIRNPESCILGHYSD